MRAMHHRFPTMPFYIVGKEISLEDVRLALEKMPDRLFEHPATVLVLTNMYYSEAPWLRRLGHRGDQPRLARAGADRRHRARFRGADHRAATFPGRATGAPRSGPHQRQSGLRKPVVLVIYRDDHKFLLDPVRPRRGGTRADYDLVIASQPYRARARSSSRPRCRAAGARARAGRAADRHPFARQRSRARDHPESHLAGRESVHHRPPQLLRATKAELGAPGASQFQRLCRCALAVPLRHAHAADRDQRTIGTSTLFAAWNAAIYVAQIEDQRLSEAIGSGAYLDATKDVLREHGGLWFWDESYVISRKRDSG
jgi:hypothetical protein